MWILILTITMKAGAGVSMQEFNTIESCESAKKAWIAQVEKQKLTWVTEASAICVKK